MKLPDRTEENMLSGPGTGSASPRAWLAQIARSVRLGATERAYPLHACVLALALAGCKHVSELQVASHTDAAAAANIETHEVISAGPEHIVMTVEEYEQLCPGPSSPDGSDTRASAAHELGGIAKLAPGGLSAAPHPVVPSILTRRTVTVTDRGPSLDDLRQLSTLQSKVNTALEVKEEKKSGPVGLFAALLGLWPVVLIGGAVLAGFVVWKLKPPWLSFLFKLLGRTP